MIVKEINKPSTPILVALSSGRHYFSLKAAKELRDKLKIVILCLEKSNEVKKNFSKDTANEFWKD